MQTRRSFLSLLCCAAAALLFAAAPSARADGWQTDYAKALKDAKAGNKMVLMDFTGSDWCSWCMKLDKEVFSQAQFKAYAKENLILVKLDFPQGFQLPMMVAKQNKELAAKYAIEGYPTVIVLNPNGDKVGQLGYQEGGPGKFVDALKALPKS